MLTLASKLGRAPSAHTPSVRPATTAVAVVTSTPFGALSPDVIRQERARNEAARRARNGQPPAVDPVPVETSHDPGVAPSEGSWSEAQVKNTRALAELQEKRDREVAALQRQIEALRDSHDAAVATASKAHTADLAARKLAANTAMREVLQPAFAAFVADPNVTNAGALARVWQAQSAAVLTTCGVQVDGRVALEEMAEALRARHNLSVGSLPRPSDFGRPTFEVARDAAKALDEAPVNRVRACEVLLDLESSLRVHSASNSGQPWPLTEIRAREIASRAYFVTRF